MSIYCDIYYTNAIKYKNFNSRVYTNKGGRHGGGQGSVCLTLSYYHIIIRYTIVILLSY